MPGGCSTLGSLFQLLLYFTQELIHFFSSFFVELRLVGGKMVQELQEFSGMDPLFVGDVLQHCDGRLVVSGLGELHVHLHCLILGGHYETNGTHQFLFGQLTFIGETRKRCSKTWHDSNSSVKMHREKNAQLSLAIPKHSMRRQR